ARADRSPTGRRAALTFRADRCPARDIDRRGGSSCPGMGPGESLALIRPAPTRRPMSRHRITSHPVLSRAQARRHYSQNFLADPAAARAVVRASGVGAGELVVEIGPGDGMLTRHLLDTAGRVLAYEIDARHAAALRARYAGDDRLRCHHADIRNVRPPREPFAVVANIPFAASTDILRWCLAAQQLTSATLLAQKEFARKYSGHYRRWPKTTVAHWPAVRTSLGPALARDRFRPVPRVDAAVLRLHRRERALLSH